MTSDAKIGLLLGLVFIFIIAFLINGLPSFRTDKDSNQLTTSIVGLQNERIGIGNKELEAIKQTAQFQGRRHYGAGPQVRDGGAVLPAPSVDTPSLVQENERPDSGGPPVGPEPVVAPVPLAPSEPEPRPAVEPKKPALPEVYVVQEGDNLTVVAKKFYGEGEGNKIANIARIFQANRSLLKRPDKVYAGQRILIPPLHDSYRTGDKGKDILLGPMFEPVEKIGERHLANNGPKSKQSTAGVYVVRQDDSLWRIAAEQLGDGRRYTEIVKLNSGILDDEDFVEVGTRLQIPAR